MSFDSRKHCCGAACHDGRLETHAPIGVHLYYAGPLHVRCSVYEPKTEYDFACDGLGIERQTIINTNWTPTIFGGSSVHGLSIERGTV